MTLITINSDLGGHKEGDTIDIYEGAAELLVTNGYAEVIEEAQSKPRGKTKAATSGASEAEGGGDSHLASGITAG